MRAKLNPVKADIFKFHGLLEILDFTSAGSESSVSATVDGDADREYVMLIRNLDAADAVNLLLNGDTSTYGFQSMTNTAATMAAARDTSEATIILCPALSITEAFLATPTGLQKTLNSYQGTYSSSGTTIANFNIYAYAYDGTANITSLDFSSASGNFTAGTRITVYKRKSL